VNEKNCYVILTPSQSVDETPGWTAKFFDPVRQQWTWVAGWHPNREGALQEAEIRFQELIRENELTQLFNAIIDDFQEKGFSLQEILNSLAELVHRKNYPSQVGYFLEQASAAAE
jgi:hypothetical protein